MAFIVFIYGANFVFQFLSLTGVSSSSWSIVFRMLTRLPRFGKLLFFTGVFNCFMNVENIASWLDSYDIEYNII